MRGLYLSLTIFISLVHVCHAKKASIPGYVGPELNLKTGYGRADDSMLFYVHVSLTPNPSRVAVWYQGGPGGSSMIGLFEEMGPLNPVNNAKVEYRDINWLIEDTAMIFIDNPACVGFSYTLNPNRNVGCNSSDSKSAAQNHVALKQILDDLGYSNLPLWITGESWAGIYVPMLSALLTADSETHSQFAGFAVGNPEMNCIPYGNINPVTDPSGDVYNNFGQMYWNGYVSQEMFAAWNAANCQSEEHRRGKVMPRCREIFDKVTEAANLGPDFDPDDRFQDPCTGNGTLAFATTLCDASTTPENIDVRTNNYLEQPHVAAALGAHVQFGQYENYFDYTSDAGSMLPFYESVMRLKNTAKILIYSGLSDVFTVPFTSTLPCLEKLVTKVAPRERTAPWQVWTVSGGLHTAGHWEQYGSTLLYATVRGGGHEVPLYQPFLAREMWRRLIVQGNISDIGVSVDRARRLPHPRSQSALLRKFRAKQRSRQ